MALDVYVGSLTRYYVGEWENVSERAARGRGVQRQPVRPSLPEGEAERIRLAMTGWRATLAQALGDRVEGPLDWDESPDGPYFTGRPGWDGFGSLVLWAAYAEHPALRLPDSLPEEWDNDPALVRSNAEGFRSRYSHLVRNVELWLPGGMEFTFEAEDVHRRRVVMGSSTTLRRQLSDLNGATWKAAASVVGRWGRSPPPSDATLELRARYGFAVLFGLCDRAVEQRLPMKLDY